MQIAIKKNIIKTKNRKFIFYMMGIDFSTPIKTPSGINLLSLSTDEDPDNRDKFEEQNDSTEQEQSNTEEGKCE